MASPALPGLFFCFAAMVLLIFATVSSPVWEAISFLNVERPGGDVHFGVLGYTGSGAHVGWRIDESTIGYEETQMNRGTYHNLTYTLVLIPIGAALSGLAVIFGLCGMAYSRIGTIFMSLSAALATLVTLVAWVLEMVFFGVLRNRINSHAPASYTATFGNANWMVLAAVVSLFLGFCTGLFGSCGRYRRTERV